MGDALRIDLAVRPTHHTFVSGKRIPTIDNLISGLKRANLDVMAITSDRFYHWFAHYVEELRKSRTDGEHYCVDNRRGVITYSAIRPDWVNGPVYLIDTQLIGALEDKKAVPINVLGVPRIQYFDRIEETSRRVHKEGGIVFVLDPGMKKRASIEKTKDLWEAGLINGVNLSSRISRGDYERIINNLGHISIPIIPVSNARNYGQAGTSYIEMQGDIIGKFTMDDFSRKLDNTKFVPNFHPLPLLRKLLSI